MLRTPDFAGLDRIGGWMDRQPIAFYRLSWGYYRCRIGGYRRGLVVGSHAPLKGERLRAPWNSDGNCDIRNFSIGLRG